MTTLIQSCIARDRSCGFMPRVQCLKDWLRGAGRAWANQKETCLQGFRLRLERLCPCLQASMLQPMQGQCNLFEQ